MKKYFFISIYCFFLIQASFAQKKGVKTPRIVPAKNTEATTVKTTTPEKAPVKAPPLPKYMTEEEARNLLKDTDGDGVMDLLDRENSTPPDCPVDTRGVSLDSDGDGVKDCDDKEPYSQPGNAFDVNGVSTKLNNDGYNLCPPPIPFFHSNPIYFAEDSYVLSAESQASLKSIARSFVQNNKLCFIIEGYTSDREGKEENYSKRLSYNRAKAVVTFLSAYYGIAEDRLKIKIKGIDNIIKENDGKKDNDRFNRRVEIVNAECPEASDAKPENTLEEKENTSVKKKKGWWFW